MSLFALPVTVSDLTTLQQGIEFSTDTVEATAEAAAINSGAQTVFAYAAELINANLPFSQVAMATTALMFGETATTAVLQNISLNFLPSQVAVASATLTWLFLPLRRRVWRWRDCLDSRRSLH